MTESAKALTRAMYHLKTGKEYLEVFKLDCESSPETRHAAHHCRSWVNKLNFIENDAMFLMTEESREHFRQEIKRGDVLFLSSLSEQLLMLDERQRAMVEDLVTAMVKGNPLELVKPDKIEAA